MRFNLSYAKKTFFSTNLQNEEKSSLKSNTPPRSASLTIACKKVMDENQESSNCGKNDGNLF